MSWQALTLALSIVRGASNMLAPRIGHTAIASIDPNKYSISIFSMNSKYGEMKRKSCKCPL